MKVVAKDGIRLFLVRGGRLITVNTDHAQLATFDGEFLGHRNDGTVDNKQNKDNSVSIKTHIW